MSISIGTVWVGDKFSERYLVNLYAMLKRNISEPFEFYVITDKMPVIRHSFPFANWIIAREGIYGWWHYIEFFSGDLPTPIMYVGLDTVIREDITDVAKTTQLMMSRDFNYLIGNPNKKLADTYADCCAVIPEGGFPKIYDKFVHQHSCKLIGHDHSTLMHVWVTGQFKMYEIKPTLWQDVDPGLMTSYKWPQKKLREPSERIVFWHGEPQIHECLNEAPWICTHWHSGDL